MERLLVLLFVFGAALAPREAPDSSSSALAAIPPPPKRVTSRPANTGGKVPILMYHRVGAKEAYMVRSSANFLHDLESMYKSGYRPVTLTQYITNKMPLPSGSSPVVLTFDDSHPSQIRLTKTGAVDPSTFVGIWMKFAKTHPDFPLRATFFCNNNGPFGKEKDARKAIEILQAAGSEIASHTARHRSLAHASREAIYKEIGSNIDYLEARGAVIRTFAPPYGAWPSPASILDGSFGRTKAKVKFIGVVAAGDRPGHSPVSSRFDSRFIPRIGANDGIKGMTWWFEKAKKGTVELYVQP